MHMVLLGVDLLRMHNNSDLFDTTKQEKGFYNIMQKQRPEALKTGLRHSKLHNLSDENLHSLAAVMASLLLAQQMANEALLVQLPRITDTQVGRGFAESQSSLLCLRWAKCAQSDPAK
jgi:hypothetical protein